MTFLYATLTRWQRENPLSLWERARVRVIRTGANKR